MLRPTHVGLLMGAPVTQWECRRSHASERRSVTSEHGTKRKA